MIATAIIAPAIIIAPGKVISEDRRGSIAPL